MPQKLPPIKVIARVDPALAKMVREVRRLRRVPLDNLKKAAMEYGREASHGRVGLMGPALPKLVAAAAGYYFYQSRK